MSTVVVGDKPNPSIDGECANEAGPTTVITGQIEGTEARLFGRGVRS